jgi:hypothetical protein
LFLIASLPIPALAVSMIELPFRALPMAFVGLPPLGAPGLDAAWVAAITVSAIAVRADQEHGLALLGETNPVQQNRVTVFVRHAWLEARLDNGTRFVTG